MSLYTNDILALPSFKYNTLKVSLLSCILTITILKVLKPSIIFCYNKS